ncbi:MAG TPA: hypothetical protein VHM20_07440, partial [Gammaproteobacteria bacterium]|nr:hypothetical protein [Gammaproteobacteria bacterium]
DANNIFQCDINSSDGTFSSCLQTTMANTSYYTSSYGSLVTNTANSFAYLVDNGSNGFSNNILVCPISAGMISSTCSPPAALSNSSAGESIAITRNGNTVYVADYSDQGVYVCETSGGGSTIGSCVLKTGDGSISFGSIAGVALNPAETLLYITAYNTGNIYACTTTPNGTNDFDHCFAAGTGMLSVAGITINALGTKAYIGTFGSDLYTCDIQLDGSFNLPCTLTSGFSSAMSVALGY